MIYLFELIYLLPENKLLMKNLFENTFKCTDIDIENTE